MNLIACEKKAGEGKGKRTISRKVVYTLSIAVLPLPRAIVYGSRPR